MEPSLVTPILHRRASQGIAGGVGDRPGTGEFLSGGIGAGVRRFLNNGLQPLLRLGERAKAISTEAQKPEGIAVSFSCDDQLFFASSVNGLVSTGTAEYFDAATSGR